MDCFFPGLKAKYGDKLPVDVEYNIDALKNFVAKEASETLSANGDVTLKFWVNTSATEKALAVQLKLNTLFFEFNAIIDGMQLKANVHNATLGPVTVVTTFGDLDMTEVK